MYQSAVAKSNLEPQNSLEVNVIYKITIKILERFEEGVIWQRIRSPQH